ncbi:hypothetical protein BH09VER1_BH09VER1_24550 [soil metagenome]
MELAIIPTGGGAPFLLTGTLSEEGMQSGTLDNSRAMEFAAYVDGDGIEALDRGNDQNTLNFIVERTWNTPGDAASYFLTHEATVPRTGRLRMRAQQPGGAVVITKYLNGAGIPNIKGTFDGCGTKFQYTVVGGTITTS